MRLEGVLVADLASDLANAAKQILKSPTTARPKTEPAQPPDAPASTQTSSARVQGSPSAGTGTLPNDISSPQAQAPVSGPDSQWHILKLGQSGNGVTYRRIGNEAIAFLDRAPIAKCVKESKLRGLPRESAEFILKESQVHVSPTSPTGQFIAMFCADPDSASGVQFINLRTKAFFSPNPPRLFEVLNPWVTFSPDDRYAVLNQSGDEGNYSPLVLNLSTQRAAKLVAPLVIHEEKNQPSWITDTTIKYRNKMCTDKSCGSWGNYELEVDVSSLKVKRKRIAD